VAAWGEEDRPFLDPIPPGHGEGAPASPGSEPPRCWCGRQLNAYTTKDGTGVMLMCPQHGRQEKEEPSGA